MRQNRECRKIEKKSKEKKQFDHKEILIRNRWMLDKRRNK